MAARAGRSDGPDRIDRPALIVNGNKAVLQRQLFGPVHMALRAIAAVARKAHLAEVVLGAAKAVDNQRPAVCLELLARVDLVDHLGEV